MILVGQRPLDGWDIVLSGTRNFLGKPDVSETGKLTYGPIYELRVIVDPRVGIVRQCLPVLMYPVERLGLGNVTAIIEVNSLPLGEAEILQKAVSDVEEAMVHLRAHQTGIVTATAEPGAVPNLLAA